MTQPSSKEQVGNIFCVFALSIRHALLKPLSLFIPLMEKAIKDVQLWYKKDFD